MDQGNPAGVRGKVSPKKRGFRAHGLYYRTLLAIRYFSKWDSLMRKVRPGSFFYPLAVIVSKKLFAGLPLVIKIDLTNRCNLRCKMCYSPHDERQGTSDAVREVLRQIGSVPVRLGLMGGEPMLCEELCEIIALAKSRSAVREVFLYTNASLITEEKAGQLKEAGLDKAIVTLVSHDSVKHDAFTGVKGSWESTVAGIRSLSRAGIKVDTFTPLHAENIGDLTGIHGFVTRELGVTPYYYQYVPQKGIDDPLRVSPEKWQEAKHRILYELSEKHSGFFKRSVSTFGSLCLGGRCNFFVQTDGTVTPCPFVSDIVLGNIFRDDLWNVLSHPVKGKGFGDFFQTPAECKGCSYEPVCGGGCRAGNKSLFGSYAVRDYRCLKSHAGPICDQTMCDQLPNFF